MRNLVLALTMAALAASFAATGALAADKGVTSPPFGFGMRTAPPPPPPSLVTVFNNIDWNHPNALYNCCNGFAVSGPDNLVGAHMLFDAMGFTPTVNIKVTAIQLAASYSSGTNEFSLALYSDNAGVPGTALKVWQVTNLPPYGSCCALATVTDPGIQVLAGHKYWVVMRTDHTSLDTAMMWNTSLVNPTLHLPFAQYCSADVQGPACTTPNDQWTASTLAPALAFAVFGKG